MKLWKRVTVLLFPPSFPLPFLLNLFFYYQSNPRFAPTQLTSLPPTPSLIPSCHPAPLLPSPLASSTHPGPASFSPSRMHRVSSQLSPSLCFLTLLLSAPSPESPWPYGIMFCAWTSPSQAICKIENKAVSYSFVFLYTQHRAS